VADPAAEAGPPERDGRVAEVGTQEDLMAREDGIYRRLATLQAVDDPNVALR